MNDTIHDQKVASEWAESLLARDNWCILDTETTGLGNDAQICQIAAIAPNGEKLLNELVKPTISIEPGASAIHGITDEQVKKQNSFDWTFLNLLRAVGSRDIVIYNAEFDLRLIRQSMKAHGIQLAFPTSDRRQCRIFTNGGSIHCAMQFYSQWVGDWNEYHGNYRWQKLPGGDHTALGDCLATLAVIQRMKSSY
jgi:DNA polymerase III subunit epsilon